MTLTAVLFAGGASRRMGVEKATLMWQGEPLWSRQLRVLRELQPDVLWISARTRPAWCPPEIEVVGDEPPARGPLSGLAAVLGRARTTHLLALAIDLPQMTSEHLKKLWQSARPGCGVMPATGKHFEPLCAIYPADAAASAKEALAGADVSLQQLAAVLIDRKQLKPCVVSEREMPLYQNTNTPSEFAASRSRSRGS